MTQFADKPENLPSGFVVEERREDEFGVLYVSQKGTTFRISVASPVVMKLKKKYLTMSGDPSTTNKESK